MAWKLYPPLLHSAQQSQGTPFILHLIADILSHYMIESVYLAWILRAWISISVLHNLGYCNATTSLLPLFPFIPFSPSLLHPLSSQVEGTFLLDVPPVLLGYEHPSSLVTTQTLTSDLKSSGHTHLQLFIALEPPLSVLPPIKDQVGMNQACITLDTKLVILL